MNDASSKPWPLCASNSNILSMEISKEILNDIADSMEAGF
jgi:hypothetical protein